MRIMAFDLEARVVRLESQMEHVATKEDIARLEGLIIGSEGSIKADAAERETRMVKWFIGSVVVVGGFASGLTALLMRLV